MKKYWYKSFIVLIGLLCLLLQEVMAQQVTRIAIAGISHGHSSWIYNRKTKGDLEIVGIYEQNEVLVQRFMKEYQLPRSLFYDDLTTMLTKVKPQGVMAFGPVNEHVEVVRACAPKKIHVMVEKPLATTYADALEIQRLAKQHQIKVLTNFETSWYASNQYVRDLYKKGELGDLRKVLVNDGHGGPSQMDRHFIEWLADPVKNGGGALTDFGCYGGNLMTWLMEGKRPQSVTAITAQNRPDLYPKVDDEATIVLQYPGVQCIIQASWSWTFSRKDMELFGTKGYAKALDRLTVATRLKSTEAEKKMTLSPRIFPFEDPFAVFAQVIEGTLELEDNDLYELPINVTTVEILEAARKSAQLKKTIFLE